MKPLALADYQQRNEALMDQVNETCTLLENVLIELLGEDAAWELHVGVDELPRNFFLQSDMVQDLWQHRESCNSLLDWLTKDDVVSDDE
jgi:hypothetical protein